jgi:SdrD B-like domain
MMQTRKWAALSMLTVAGGLAACADQSVLTAPAAIADAPTLGVNAAGEGELIICKAGNASGTFTFDYSFVTLVGTVDLPGGTVSVDAGSCVTVVSQPGNGRWRATITEQAPPANWALTSITIVPSLVDAGNPSVDVPNRTASANISNDLGETFTFTNTFTPPPTGEIGDFVWDDLNGNGIQDSGEPGIAGVTVTLSGAASGSTTTDANGYYSFTGLSAGSYTVTVATPAGYNATPSNQGGDPTKDSNGSPASVTLAANNSVDLTIDFGYVKLQGPACTLTQGYWKTHPEDWDNGEKYVKTTDLFYNSGVSYLNLLWTSPSGGNAYVQLAHQFIAASLNVNGTSGSGVASVDAALAGAAAYFASAPAGIPTPSGSLRTQLLAWATTLDNYNNGLIGPGHCN